MPRRAAIALIPLLLLPNFLFLIPIVSAIAAPPSQPPGQPLPPGTVNYRNTWNQTLTCPKVTAPAESLVSEPNGWKTTLQIPSLLFMGTPQGSYITQSFGLSSNGTFSVSDDHGNSFSLKVPNSGSGTKLATSLVGNSTTAVQETTASVGPVVMSDIKLTFSVYKQFCQPAGVRLEITGTEAWGSSGQGTVKIVFDHRSTSFSKYRAWFGNNSGIALGFDWSDSSSLSPSFNSLASTLSYNVGPKFSIDPVTVSSGSSRSTAWGFQRLTFFAQGLYWVFYSNGTSYLYSTSSDGSKWSAGTYIRAQIWSRGGFAVWYNQASNTVYYAVATNANNFLYRYGSASSSGALSWNISEAQVTTACGGTSTVSIALDSSGNPWVAVGENSCYYAQVEAFEYTTSWSSKLVISNSNTADLVPLTGGKMAVMYQATSVCNCPQLEEWSGSTWTNSQGPTGPATFYEAFSGATAIGDTVYMVGSYYGKAIWFLSLPYGGQWSYTTLDTRGSSTTISADNAGNVIAFTNESPARVVYNITSNGGSTWRSGVVSSNEAGFDSISGPFLDTGNLALATWTTGSSSPFNVRFTAIPITIQTAATSKNAWSRPGLSPYESYFSHFSDYVSPGNGLVSVEAGTLSLSGRGVDFAPTLVYGEPYTFRSSGSSYLYDNYTGASLGYGWSLNFPWLGTNYLHLSDGQAFPYSWNGNTFQYNGVENFVLTKNTGSTYTLNMSSGTLYRFDTSKRLLSVTDRTGNNAISFSYGANNYISQVIDTIGRTITFGYNGNNQLNSISQGGRTWTLGYVGTQFTTLTDPLSRVATFQYVGTSGANAWLLSAVIWPTGGKVTYTYSSAPVGTEASTYYATSRNVYFDSTHLSQSQSISPGLVNGQMVWSNSTISDGTATRSYLFYNFQSNKNLMKAFSYDGTQTLQRITETDSDTAGRTNRTAIISPSGRLLMNSTYKYDNWGNPIYSWDNVGHQTWFSYANASPTSSFGTSGCKSSFYTQPTINPNIHDLILGQCDYQNKPGSIQQQTYYLYDASGNLKETKVLHPSNGWLYTDYTYDIYGNVITLKNPDGFYTNSTYSSTYSSAYLTKQNSTISRLPYKFAVTTWTWNSTLGEQATMTDPRTYTTSYKYDNIGRLTLISYGGSTYAKAYSYDDTHNVMTVTDENGHVTKDYFDGLARQTKVERWNGSSVYSSETYTYNWLDLVATKTTATVNTYTYFYDWNGQLTKLMNPDRTNETTSYDYVNNLKTVTDENNHQTVYIYNWNNWLLSVKQYNSSTNYYLTTYSYDLSGNLLSTTDAHSTGQTTFYQYDNLNRLNMTTFPDGRSETRTYDNLGNLLTRTTANSSTISYTYDGLNRLTKVTYPGTGGTVTYTYDANGNKVKMISPSAQDYYTYSMDALCRLTNQTEYVGGVKYQTLYTYDGVGGILTLAYPDGYVLTMTYDGLNRLKKVGVGGLATVGYTVDDKISKITYGNGVVATYTYDSRDRPTQIQDKSGSTKLLSLNYTYDGTGNVKTLNTETYKYDWLNRLNYSSGPWGSYTYVYDQVGNRIRMVQGSTTTRYCYGSYNRLSGYYTTTSCSSPAVSYTYDANGNMITKTGGWTYSYDYENRLLKVVQSSTTKQQNYYDGNGNRVKQVAGSSTFTYSYQGLNILYEKNVTGGTTITKHFYAGGLQMAKTVGSTTYYLHQDALGSTRLETTSTVTIKFSSNYVPYGNNYALTGKEVFMYTGKPSDSTTGLYYYGARFYDPAIGRFVTQDSNLGNPADPFSLNRYIYARDNPENLIDPNGHNYIPPQVTHPSGPSAFDLWWNSLPPNEQHAIIESGIIVTAAAVAIPTFGTGSAVIAVGAAGGAITYTATEGPNATPGGAASEALISGAVSYVGGPIVSRIAERALSPIIGYGIRGIIGATASSIGGNIQVTQHSIRIKPVALAVDTLTSALGPLIPEKPRYELITQIDSSLGSVFHINIPVDFSNPSQCHSLGKYSYCTG